MAIMYMVVSSIIWYRYLPRLLSIIEALSPIRPGTVNFLVCTLIGGAVTLMLLKRRSHYLLTSSHEMAHTIMAFLMLSPVYEYHVNRDGSGSIRHAGRMPRLVSYSPYFLFPLTTVLILVSPVINREYQLFYLRILGVVTGMRLFIILNDIRTCRIQSDLKQYGLLQLLYIVSGFLLLSVGIILSYLSYPFTLRGIVGFLV